MAAELNEKFPPDIGDGSTHRLLICDSVEDGIAVLLPHEPNAADGPNFIIPAAKLAALSGVETAEKNCYRCTVENGEIVAAMRVTNETAGENHRRLKRLFKERH